VVPCVHDGLQVRRLCIRIPVISLRKRRQSCTDGALEVKNQLVELFLVDLIEDMAELVKNNGW
jgi:hypothetical protein